MGHEVVVEEEDDDEHEAGQNNNTTNYSLMNPTSMSPAGGSVDRSGRSVQPVQPQLSAELSMELPTYDLLHNQDAYDGPGIAYTLTTYTLSIQHC